LFYDYLLSKRNPIFLNRNFVRALEIDQHILEHGSTDRLPGDGHRHRPKWQPPSLETLGEIMDSRKPNGSFYLDPYSIKPRDKHTTPHHSGHRNKSRALFTIKCTINVFTYHADSKSPCAHRSDPEATISGSDRNGERNFMVSTVPMDPITFGEMSRRAGSTDTLSTYKMRFTISFYSTADAKEFFKHLVPEYVKETHPMQLSAVWDDIMHVPKGKVILPLRDEQGPLHLGLEVAMYRIRADDTPALVEYNRRLRTEASSTKCLTRRPEVQYKLTFVYGDRTVEHSRLVCPHCLDRRKPADMDFLRLHLDAWHDHLSYRVVDHDVDAVGIQHWTFECEVENHKPEQRASAKADEPFDVLVIPPQVPFNRREFLDEGNDEYQRAAKLERSARPIGRNGRTTTTSSGSNARQKPPLEVQPRALVEKKRFRVPKAPNGIRFFRLVSKRPLEEGEYISESDDDIDETWIQQRKIAEKKRCSAWSQAQRTLLAAFDLFMHEEGVNSDVHAEACLIRFARCKAAWIWQNQVWNEFEAKIDELREDKIISQAAHSTCVEIVQKDKPAQLCHSRAVCTGSTTLRRGRSSTIPTTSSHALSGSDTEMPDAPPSPSADSAKQSTAPISLPYNQCFCGFDAQASFCTGAIIECANLVSFPPSKKQGV
jgi:hypothetical protein